MENNTLRDLYIDQLKDLYDAENRLTKALPKMAKNADSEELRDAIEEHLEQTRGHVDRLKQIFTSLGEKPSGKKCVGMIGILDEGEEILHEDYEESVMDAAIISAAQRVEHYEIAAYGCVHAWAEILGETEASSLLEKTLDEEKLTDQKLTELAEDINSQAHEADAETGEEEEEPRPKARSAKAGS
jgi:ferritin-like metal-binding protein YciE